MISEEEAIEFEVSQRIPSLHVSSQGAHDEQARALKRSRAGYIGLLTRNYNEIKDLMIAEPDIEEILERKTKLHNDFVKFQECHNKYCDVLKCTLEQDEALAVYNKVCGTKNDMDIELETWIAMSQLNNRVMSTPLVDPSDSVSQCGSEVGQCGSKVSQSSTSSTLKLRAKAKQAKALLRLKQLKEQQALEEQRLEREAKLVEMKSKQAFLKAQHEIDQASLEVEIYGEADAEEGIKVDGMNDYLKKYQIQVPNTADSPSFKQVSPVIQSQISNVDKEATLHSEPVVENLHEKKCSPFLNPSVPEWVPGTSKTNHTANPTSTSPSDITSFNQSSIQQLLQHQQQMMQCMANAMTLPKPELFSFDGNPLNYWRFIRSFEKNIESKVEDQGEKLNYLLQYCSGNAKEVIKNCVVMDSEVGYNTAREMLYDRFGEPYTIACAYIEKITGGPILKSSDRQGLLAFADNLKDCKLTLESIGYLDDINSSDNLRRIAERLPIHLKGRWLDIAGKIRKRGERPRIDHLANFVVDRAKAANDPVFGRIMDNDKLKTKGYSSTNAPKASTFATQVDTDSKENDDECSSFIVNSSSSPKPISYVIKCPLCSGSHYLYRCEEFKGRSFEDRRKVVRENRLCDNCLKPGHIARGCWERSFCQVEGCKGKHQALLHPPTDLNAVKGNSNQNDNEALGMSAKTYAIKADPVNKNSQNIKKRICLPIVPVRVCGRNQSEMVETYALLDKGSDTSLCEKGLLERLKLRGVEKAFTLTTVEKEKSQRKGVVVGLTVTALDSDDDVELPAVLAVDKLPISINSRASAEDVKLWPHLAGVELPEIDHEEVTLLIGNDAPEVFWVLEERRGRKKEPYAVKSILGWTLVGPTEHRKESNFNVNFVRLEDQMLQQQVEKFWKTDFGDSIADPKSALSVEDRRALTMMEKSATLVDGHYQIALPWRHGKSCMPNNRSLAESRLRLLKRRFTKDSELFQKYKETISGYIEKGHAIQLSDDQLRPQERDVWYLPHHPVVHPQKPDKVRVVFDCAATFKGTSLNDQLLQGPDLTNSLVGVLTRFRQDSVALVADIEGMFHQVRVSPDDCNVLRFLWWPNGDLNKEPMEYQMTVHLFGATSSPSCANFALKKTAKDNQHFDAETIDTVHRNFYVDDCLKSVESNKDAVRLSGQLCDLLSKGGFHLTKWICNRREVIDAIPESERAQSLKDLDWGDLPVERTLGLQWNVETDKFGFKIVIKDKPPTRRGMLSIVSSVYDPLGLVAPFVLSAKKLLQDVCKASIGWDEPIPVELIPRWEDWLSGLPKLSMFKVDRCFKPSNFGKVVDIQLHHFSDASQVAYGAVSYLRIVNTEGKVHCSFVIGKSRLAPLKTATIPRLELSGAVVSVKLNVMLVEEMDLPVSKSTFWTDSTTVLQYIENESKRFHTFVANRLAIIHDGSTPSQWRYVDTKSNPSDEASRGLTANQMLDDERWLRGPSFLWEDEQLWPVRPNSSLQLAEDNPDVKRDFQVNAIEQELEDVIDSMFKRHSSWYCLKKNVAWLLRFRCYIKYKYRQTKESVVAEQFRCGKLSVAELRTAEIEIIKYVQGKEFKEEIVTLKSTSENIGEVKNPGRKSTKKSIKRSSTIYKLNPELKDGVLSVGGRLGNAPISENAKHPSILPKNHHVTDLIIRHYHLLSSHAGKEHVLSMLRERFWIVKARVAVRRLLGSCFDCRRRSAATAEQIMADLPVDRLTPDKPPFSYVGIDFFGPFLVKRARSIVKRYGCVFTCLNIRAIHIEVAHSLETDSFIDALHRFINRRGKPVEIRSDNGTNFRGADRELRESIQEWNQQKIDEFLRQREITWKFNPPAASSMGGVWERMIRSIRKILRVLLKAQQVNDETLLTFMTHVEAVLNSRPLTCCSDDPRDAEPLTPNHLLLLRSNSCLPPGVFNKQDMYCCRKWRQAQYLADQFWRRWIVEYLPTLQERQKWNRPTPNVAVGDVVLIADQNIVRGLWPLGLVQEVHMAPDGYVRSAKVKTSTTVLTRPVNKLCLLERSERAVEAP